MNPVVHFEILAGPDGDKKALQAFYRDTFKWDVDADNPMDYGMVTPDDEDDGIGGAVDSARIARRCSSTSRSMIRRTTCRR